MNDRPPIALYTSVVGYVLQIASSSARGLSVATRSPARIPNEPLRFPPAPVERHNALGLWHLLSLDAPTVAAVWTAFLARCNGFALPASSIAAMFAAVWLLYAGDRLLDARPAAAGLRQLEARHRFHARHSLVFRAGIVLAVLVLAILLPGLPPAAIRLYLIEGSFLAGYFLLIHAVRSSPRLPKEFAVGLFFAVATFIPTIARQPGLSIPMIAPACLLAALCSLNCLFIYRWEHPSHNAGSPGDAHPATSFALRYLRAIALLLLLGALVCVWLQPPAARTIAGAIAASTTLLLALDACRERLPAITLRAIADLALLTPVLFLVFP